LYYYSLECDPCLIPFLYLTSLLGGLSQGTTVLHTVKHDTLRCLYCLNRRRSGERRRRRSVEKE